jgi:hypothetical protein
MTRRRVAASLAISSLVIGVAGSFVIPVASADALSNGLTVQCMPNNANIGCSVSGCPRVGDYVVDALHVILSAQSLQGSQDEYDYPCQPNGTVSPVNILTFQAKADEPLTVGVQVCRKVAVGSDKCGAWSNYTYTPPAQASAPANNSAPPANNPKPVFCTGGPDAGQTLPPGSSCPAAPAAAPAPPTPPTNAVTLHFQKNGFQINAIIVNNSDVAGQCQYDAVNTNGIIPERTDSFPIGAHATVTRPYPAPPPLAQFHATVTCSGDFNGTSDEFGNTSADVTG